VLVFDKTTTGPTKSSQFFGIMQRTPSSLTNYRALSTQKIQLQVVQSFYINQGIVQINYFVS